MLIKKKVFLVFFLLSFYLFVVGKSAQANPPCCTWPTPAPQGLSPWITWPSAPTSTPVPKPSSSTTPRPPTSTPGSPWQPTATPTSVGQPATPTGTTAPGVPTATPVPAVPEGGGSVGGSVEAPVCSGTVPPAPVLLSVNSIGIDQVKLTWTAVNPVTHYAISYGLSSGNYQYGVSNTGNVTFFNVGALSPNTKYCFAIRAVNDCAPSGLSNEICAGGGVTRVLGATVLGATGGIVEELVPILVIIGSICVALGLRNFHPDHRKA